MHAPRAGRADGHARQSLLPAAAGFLHVKITADQPDRHGRPSRARQKSVSAPSVRSACNSGELSLCGDVRTVWKRHEPSLYVMLWRDTCPRVTVRNRRGTARSVVSAPSDRTPLRPGSGFSRLYLPLSFRFPRHREFLPRQYRTAADSRPAEPYPNTNIVLLYTLSGILSTGIFPPVRGLSEFCEIRQASIAVRCVF